VEEGVSSAASWNDGITEFWNAGILELWKDGKEEDRRQQIEYRTET
jgi:hypothetical protein